MNDRQPEDSNLKVSVALVTRNRPESLERSLHSLRGQDHQPFEVVISDDSDSAQAPTVREIARTFGCRYESGPHRGLYANRNHAACACLGSHVRSMDDDHEFPDGHFAACMEAIRSDPNVLWAIGERRPVGSELGPIHPPGELTATGFSALATNPHQSWAIADGATIYPRQVFDQGLRFCEDFKFGAAYLEFGSRLHWLGYRIRILSSTYIIHHFEPSARSFADLEAEISSRAFAALCHAYLYQPRFYNKIICIAQFAKYVLRHGWLGTRAVRSGIAAYGRHRNRLAPGL